MAKVIDIISSLLFAFLALNYGVAYIRLAFDYGSDKKYAINDIVGINNSDVTIIAQIILWIAIWLWVMLCYLVFKKPKWVSIVALWLVITYVVIPVRYIAAVDGDKKSADDHILKDIISLLYTDDSATNKTRHAMSLLVIVLLALTFLTISANQKKPCFITRGITKN